MEKKVDIGVMSTWLFEDCPCIRWGLEFRSIILVSILLPPSVLASNIRTLDAAWFWWFSVILGLWGWFLLISPSSAGCKPSSSMRPGLSPGNYTARPRIIQITGGIITVIRNTTRKTWTIMQSQTSTRCLSTRYLPWVLLPPTCTIISHCRQRELPSISQ